MSFARFSVNQSVFVNLVSVIVVIIGIVVVMGMHREVYPNVAFDMVSITTLYPAATPEDVEKFLTVPIEHELKEVDGIKEIDSTSAPGISLVYLKIDPDETDKAKVVRDIQSAVERVNDLPKDVDDPVVREITSKQYPIIELSLSGDMTRQRLEEYVDVLKDELEDIKGVARVDKKGAGEREMQVLLDPEKIRKYYVSIDEIENALRLANVNIPAGKMDTPRMEYSIRTSGEFLSRREIEDVVIRANDSGNWLKIKDVALVQDTFKDEDIITKTRGTRSINLVVMKKESGDAIDIVREVKKTSARFLGKLSSNLEVSYINDYSFFVKRRLNVLKGNACFALFFVIGCMLIFFEKRVAFFTVLGIPIAFFTTFIVMDIFGITINLISMFGLVVVLGMLVDDGIIVAENVYRYMENGMPPREAAIKGTDEVVGAVLAAVLTTVAAFLPLLFMTGIIGRFTRNIPAVVITALLASLTEAFIMLPSHLADFVRVKLNPSEKARAVKKNLVWFKKLVSSYGRMIGFAIDRKYRVLAGFLVSLTICACLAFTVLRFVLFPSAGINFFFIRMEAPVGTPLETMEKLAIPVERIVAELPKEELDTYVTTIGKMEEDRLDPFTGKASHYAQITVYLTLEQDRKRKVSEIINDLREKTKDASGFTDFRLEEPETGPPVGRPIEVRIRGERFEILDKIAAEYMDYLKTISGVQDITWDHRPGKEEIRVKVDREKAARAGLSMEQIAKTIRSVFEGGIATKIKPIKAEEEIDVTVRFMKNETTSPKVFDEILVSNRAGNLIPLKKVAVIEKVPGTTTIEHFNGKRVVTVSGSVDTQKTTSSKINRMLKKKFTNISERYIGYSVKYGGEEEETADSLRSLLRAFFFAFLIVYLILASFFKSIVQPLVVMLAVPFGLIGVIVAFWVHGMPLSFMAILGIVGLNGIVVNDSIVLIDFINKLRISGMSRHESIIEACKMRLRPVMLTTTTTVVGLFTVAYGIGGKDPFLVPMAMAISWGLVFSTSLTLIVIPCIYSIVDELTVKLFSHTSMLTQTKAGTVMGE